MVKDNSKLFILVLLGMLTAFGPFVTDMYLPSLPSMGEYFSTSSSMVQLGLTTSMIGLAVGQIFFGPLSDRYGRRIPLQVAMWLFIVSTIFCLFAQNIQQFVAFRLIQGIAGAGGIVIARSIATDKFSGKDLAKMLANHWSHQWYCSCGSTYYWRSVYGSHRLAGNFHNFTCIGCAPFDRMYAFPGITPGGKSPGYEMGGYF